MLAHWTKWFAWYPVKDIHNNWVWCKFVYRCVGNTYTDHDDWRWYYYGTLFDTMKFTSLRELQNFIINERL